ncbi:hypothetical protein Q5752_006267 [Cryptotrichosporon argae]
MVLLAPQPFLGNPFETREDVQRACIGLLDPLAAHTSPGGALIDLASTATHYDLRAVAFEAFARPLWALTPLLLGGATYAGAERWFAGLAAGTDPDGPEYWGAARAKDQRMVEMSPLSFAIAMAPQVFFNKQTDKAKKDIAAFLNTCQERPMPDTNWLWFRVFANLALRSIGSEHFNPDRMQRDLLRLEEFQLPPHPVVSDAAGSGGWSRDGPEGVMQLDYYSSSFAIQYAQLVYAKLCKDDDPERSQAYIDRAQAFLLDFVYYFAPSGEAIPFGRSMVYRFAVISTFSVLALCNVAPPAPLEWGHIKGFVLRHFRSWNKSKDIFRSDGTLNIGYGYDNMNMTENYNAPGSPYWCCKAFACLGSPASHPFWTADELPYPSDLFPPLKALPDPSHIMVNSGGHTFLLSSGQYAHYYLRHAAAKYSKFSYSATFGFSCPTGDLGLEQVAGDSMLALRDAAVGLDDAVVDGETWRVRRIPLNARIVDRGTPRVHLRSSWRPYPDVAVETWLIPPTAAAPNFYLRVHKITSARALFSAEAGWATYGQAADGRALVQAFSGETSPGGLHDVGIARATTRIGSVGVVDLAVNGSGGKRQGSLVQSDPNSNVIFSRSILPTLLGAVGKGTTWIATAVFGVPFADEQVDEARVDAEWAKLPTIPDYVFE